MEGSGGMRITTNLAALSPHRVLVPNDQATERSLERLSSGLRISRAADDATGLCITAGLRPQVGGLRQAIRNAPEDIDLVRTAEGALGETASLLQRMRDLTVQAANDGALRYLLNVATMSMTAGPSSTMNSVGRMQRISGKITLTGICIAFSSAR